MSTRMHKLRAQFRAVGALALTMAAVGCGGGGGGDDSPPVAAPPPPTNSVTITGKAVDGALQGATACYDTNNNRACDSGEPASDATDAGGNFTLSVPTASAGQHRLIVNVPATAIDADHGQAVGTAFTLVAPATGSAGAQTVFVSPLTTLVQQQIDGAAQSRDEAVAFVQSQLGLAVSPLADFTAASNANNTKAAQAARLVIATQLQQAAALAPAVGQPDLSGGTVTQANVDAVVAKTVASALPTIGGAAVDPSLAGQTGTALRQAVAALAGAVVTQAGVTVPEAVLSVGLAKLPPEPASTAAPEAGGSLAALRYVSASEWYMRSFQSTAADNTPDANNLQRSYDVRTATEGYNYGSPVVSSWVLLNDRARAGDRYWNGSTWRTCDIGTRTTGTVRDANGRSNYNYCDGYERGTTVRQAGIDIAGQSMESVLVNRIRTLPGGTSGVNFADWGPSDLSALAGAAFPAGSRLYYQTGTPLETAYAYDVRDSSLVSVFAQDVANGGDARSGSPACAAANVVSAPAVSLEEMVARSPGRPCVFNTATNSDGTSLDPNEAWGLTAVSIGNIAGYYATLPAGTGNYYTNVGRLRIGFTGSGNGVTYLECRERRTPLSTRNCSVIGSGSYTIATLGDARVMSFSNLPAAAGRLSYERVFVERGGRVYYGYRNRVGTENAQVRLNLPAANALLAQLGLPALTPTDAPVRQPGAKASNAALLRGVWAVEDANELGILRFDGNGRYVTANTLAAAGTRRPGVELGWFEIDANGAASRVMELDSNGTDDFSHLAAGTAFSVNATTLSVQAGGATESVSRFPDSGTGIVGVWTTSLTDLKAPMFAFFQSGRMVSIHPYAESTGDCATARMGPPGVEAGPYTFNAGTGALAVGPRTLDTTGCTGLWDATMDPAGAIFNSTVTIAADGRSAVFTLPEGGTVTMYRVAVQ